jgi:hypothetical protein
MAARIGSEPAALDLAASVLPATGDALAVLDCACAEDSGEARESAIAADKQGVR